VSALKRHDIHMHLNFILFNRNSSVATIRENIAMMREIYADNPAAVGLPHFVFSFETDWSGEAAENALSDATYVQADLDMRSQPAAEGCFDATLEPYLEVCRLLAYEWLKKVVDLSHRAGARSPYWAANTIAAESGGAEASAPAAAGRDGVAAWYGGLAEFCLDVMALYLDRFEAGALTLENLPQAKTELFERIEAYHQRLPEPLRDVVTRENHADALTYQEAAQLVELDEYWASQIPMDPEGARTDD